MTLKVYLEQNNIKATPDDRSRIGQLISSPDDSHGYTEEDGQRVKMYKLKFLESLKTQSLIIKYFRDGGK